MTLMFNSFRSKLTFLILSLIFIALTGSTVFFIDLYKREKSASLMENELSNTIQVSNQIEAALTAGAILTLDQLSKSKEIALVIENVCNRSAAIQIISDHFLQVLEPLSLSPTSWQSEKTLFTACSKLATNSLELPYFLDSGIKLPFQNIQVLLSAPNSVRLLVIAMESLGGSGSNAWYILEKTARIRWAESEKAVSLLENPVFKQSDFSDLIDRTFVTSFPRITNIGDQYVASFASLGKHGVLLSVGSYEEAFAPIYFVIRQIVLLVGGFFFLSLLLGKIITRRLTHPLHELKTASENFGQGSLLARTPVSSSDEIGIVQTAFNSMADRIVKLVEDTKLKASLEAELNIVQKVQKWFFKTKTFKSPAHEVHGYVKMANRCGGDWWSYLEIPGKPNTLVVMIGDAAGHGISSALLTAAAQGGLSVIEGWLKKDPTLVDEPTTFLNLINRTIWRASAGEVHMTFCMAILDASTEKIAVVNAGHTRPFLLRKDEIQGEELITPVGGLNPFLGIKEEEDFSDIRTYDWKKGEKLVLYTDGLIECRTEDSEFFSKSTFIRFLRTNRDAESKTLLMELIQAREKETRNVPQEDDITLVICENTGAVR